jgi:hypothetical protein
MKYSYLIAVLAVFGIVSTEAITVQEKLDMAQAKKLFGNFVSKFQRNYRNNDEYNKRLS